MAMAKPRRSCSALPRTSAAQGGPEIGGAVHVRLCDLLVRVGAYAAGQLDGMSRAEAVRELVSLGLDHVGL
jgi:hypothetical protein